MLENALFLKKKKKKTGKIAAEGSSGWRIRPQTSQFLLPSLVLITLKLRPIISYLSDGYWGYLAKLAPPPPGSNL